jgi:hypothetical protein
MFSPKRRPCSPERFGPPRLSPQSTLEKVSLSDPLCPWKPARFPEPASQASGSCECPGSASPSVEGAGLLGLLGGPSNPCFRTQEEAGYFFTSETRPPYESLPVPSVPLSFGPPIGAKPRDLPHTRRSLACPGQAKGTPSCGSSLRVLSRDRSFEPTVTDRPDPPAWSASTSESCDPIA